MCGIAGVADFRPGSVVDTTVLRTMIARLTHRGPDGLGTWDSGDGVGLGSTRLAIVDVEHGQQPMLRSADGRHWCLTYNGELYNTRELRERLESHGQQFRTRSDTEVLLAAYAQWGRDCLAELNGIFAFALYDQQRRALFLARDRMGVKPLFFSSHDGRFLFASELKAIVAHPGVAAEVDADGLAELLINFPVRTPGNAIFRNIHELRPGHWLDVDAHGVRVQRYWAPPDDAHHDDESSTVRRTRELLEDSVSRQLVSDVPLCTLLSGGVDSSSVTALAARRRAHDGGLATFTVEYREHGNGNGGGRPNGDLPFVQEVVDHVGTRHQTVLVSTSDLLNAITDSLAARDLPTTNFDPALYLLCRTVKQHASVALSGEGSDEMFGGYWGWALKDGTAPRTRRSFPWMLIGEHNGWLLRPEIQERLQPQAYVRRLYDEAVAEMPSPPSGDAEGELRATLYILRTRFLHMLLERQDRMSMAASVEVRVPFLDHRLVEYLWNMPMPLRSLGGIEKGLLRRAMADLLPPAVRDRPKNAFPTSHDPLLTDTLRVLLMQRLAGRGAAMFQVFSREGVQRALAMQPAEGGGHYRMLLWFLVQFDAWLTDYRVRIV